MKIAFLIRDEELKNAYAEIGLSDGVNRTVGTYKAEGGDLNFVTFSIEGDTIANARVLANLRDSLTASDDVRRLYDEASAKFCELLYPHLCKFEKGLRAAITVATCAEQGNFDDKRIVELEEHLTLEGLYNMLFIDRRFLAEARKLTNGSFTRDDLLANLELLNERLLWDLLFGEEDMPTFCKNRAVIKDRRNDVMHYHKMSEATFDETRALLKEVNGEIDTYLNRVRDDVTYPKAKAENARVAAQIISETYDDMLEGIRSSMDIVALYDFGDQLISIGHIMTDPSDTSSITSIAQAAANNGSTSSLASIFQTAVSLNGSANLARAAHEMMSHHTIGLSTGVSKALESIKVSMPKEDSGAICEMQAAMASMKSMRDSMDAQRSDALKGIFEYYQSIIPHGALENPRLAANASMDFTAGLGVGAALNRTIEVGSHGGIDLADEYNSNSESDVDSDVDNATQ